MAETVKPQLASHDHCTGCGACASGCPKGAVHMDARQGGFLYPQITDGCVGCGHCAHVCPALKQREVRALPPYSPYGTRTKPSAPIPQQAACSRRWRSSR